MTMKQLTFMELQRRCKDLGIFPARVRGTRVIRLVRRIQEVKKVIAITWEEVEMIMHEAKIAPVENGDHITFMSQDFADFSPRMVRRKKRIAQKFRRGRRRIKPAVIDPDFYEKVMTKMPENRHGTEGVAFVTLYHTGMHAAAYVKLTEDQFELMENGQTRIEWIRPKNAKWCYVDIPEETANYILKHLPKYPPHVKTISGWIGRCCARAGFKGCTSDTMRHTLLYRLMKHPPIGFGMEPSEAAEVLGCTLQTAMDHYARVNRFDIKPGDFSREAKIMEGLT